MADKILKIPESHHLTQFTFDVGEVEFYRMQLEWVIKDLNNTYITVLAYIKVYGKGFSKKLLEDGILTSPIGIRNYKLFLKQSGYITLTMEEILLNENIKLVPFEEGSPLVTIFKLTPSKNNAVNHKHYRNKA